MSSDNSDEDFNKAGAVLGGTIGAINGVAIAATVTTLTGGIGAIVAPEIVAACTAVGAVNGGSSPKTTVFSGMSALNNVLGWLGGGS